MLFLIDVVFDIPIEGVGASHSTRDGRDWRRSASCCPKRFLPKLTISKLPDILPEIYFELLIMVKAQRRAVNRFRKRLKRQGMARVEINVRKDDAMLVRNVARALSSPEHEQTARALLREHFGSRRTEGLKALLASAPLEGLDLSRERDFGRNVDL